METKRPYEAEEHDPECKERIEKVLKLTEGLGLTEAGIKVCVMGMFDCCEEVMKAKKKYLLDTDWTSSEQQQVDRELWGCLIVVRRL